MAFWVVAGAKGAKSVLDVTGERIGRAEWPGKAGKVEGVVVVKKNSGYMRVVMMGEVLMVWQQRRRSWWCTLTSAKR